MLQLREDQIAELDTHALASNISRSKLVRDAVDAALHPPVLRDVEALYAAAYPTATFGTDEWGDIDAWHAAASATALADVEPW
jgi:hypothetical protein